MPGSSLHLRQDFERIVALVLVSLLAYAVFLILSPFLGAIAWAIVLAVAVWPGYVALREGLGDRPHLAALIVTLALGAALIAPLAMLVGSLTDNVRDVAAI